MGESLNEMIMIRLPLAFIATFSEELHETRAEGLTQERSFESIWTMWNLGSLGKSEKGIFSTKGLPRAQNDR